MIPYTHETHPPHLSPARAAGRSPCGRRIKAQHRLSFADDLGYGDVGCIESKAAKGGKQHQLYNLVNDPGETKNLDAEQPEVVKELAAALAKVRENDRSRP